VELILSDLGRAAPLAPEPSILLPLTLNPQPPAPNHQPPTSDDERGINRVVRQLITPDLVGVFLSRGDLSALGRRLGLPVPIGERFQMLRGLFESAGQFELIIALLDGLGAIFAAEAAALAGLAGDYPLWADTARLWRDRIAQGRVLLDELREQAGAEAAEPGP
jgi:hypothetical protein